MGWLKVLNLDVCDPPEALTEQSQHTYQPLTSTSDQVEMHSTVGLETRIAPVDDFVQDQHERGNIVGLNHNTGDPMDPEMEGIFDNYSVKRQIINSGAGAFEVAARQHLVNNIKKIVQERAQLGIQDFADALLVVPKILAENSVLDTEDAIIALTDQHERGNIVGITQEILWSPKWRVSFDNYSVKHQIINSGGF